MKKVICRIISVICVFVFLFSFVSCTRDTNSENPDAEPPKQNDDSVLQFIYEVQSQGLLENESIAHHTNVIYDQAQITVNQHISPSKNFSVASKQYDVNYVDTIFYPIGDRKVHRYALDQAGDSSVLFNEDGSVYAILNKTIATLDIEPSDSAETVQTKLEKVITEWFDPSAYQYVDVQRSLPETEENFGLYRYLYYNMNHQGYRTDYVTILVDDSGEVTGLWIVDFNGEEGSWNVDQTVENELLVLKLQDMYNTETTSYQSYNLYAPSRIVMYNNEVCVQYSVSVSVKEISTEYNIGAACKILIPIRLMTTDSTHVAE